MQSSTSPCWYCEVQDLCCTSCGAIPEEGGGRRNRTSNLQVLSVLVYDLRGPPRPSKVGRCPTNQQPTGTQTGQGSMTPSLYGLACTVALVAALADVPLIPVVEAGSGSGSALRRQNGHRRRDHVAPRGQQEETSSTIDAEVAAAATAVSDGNFGRDSTPRSGRLSRVGSRRSRGRRDWVRGASSKRAVGAPVGAGCVVGLRGGSTAEGEVSTEERAGVVRSVKVLVSTTKISSFIDVVSGDCLLLRKEYVHTKHGSWFLGHVCRQWGLVHGSGSSRSSAMRTFGRAPHAHWVSFGSFNQRPVRGSH